MKLPISLVQKITIFTSSNINNITLFTCYTTTEIVTNSYMHAWTHTCKNVIYFIEIKGNMFKKMENITYLAALHLKIKNRHLTSWQSYSWEKYQKNKLEHW